MKDHDQVYLKFGDVRSFMRHRVKDKTAQNYQKTQFLSNFLRNHWAEADKFECVEKSLQITLVGYHIDLVWGFHPGQGMKKT